MGRHTAAKATLAGIMLVISSVDCSDQKIVCREYLSTVKKGQVPMLCDGRTPGEPLPRVAMCLSGHTRSFSTQAVRTSIRVNVIEPILGGASRLDLFAFLKTGTSSSTFSGAYWRDRNITHSGGPGMSINDFNFTELQNAVTQLGATTATTKVAIGDLCFDHRVCPLAPPAFPSCNGSAGAGSSTHESPSTPQGRRRLRGFHHGPCLAQMYNSFLCLTSVRDAEERLGEPYDLVIRGRPDLLFPAPFPPPCKWPRETLTLFSDYIVVYPRKYIYALGEKSCNYVHAHAPGTRSLEGTIF